MSGVAAHSHAMQEGSAEIAQREAAAPQAPDAQRRATAGGVGVFPGEREPHGDAVQAARPPYSPAGLVQTAKALHQPRLAPFNPALLSIGAALLLTVGGIFAIDTSQPELARRQAVFAVVGVIAAALVAVPAPRHVRAAAWPLYIVTMALLVFVLLPFVPEWVVRPRNGARRWINLGVADFQPSELAKLAFVLVLALWLRHEDQHRRLKGLLAPFALTLAPMALVLVEPDLGSALLFVPVLLAMLVAAGARKRHIATIVGLGLLMAPLAYPLLEPHQKDRVNALIAQVRGDRRYEQDIGFQAARAMTLVGAGGVSGVGREHARALVDHNGLPEEHNDMIFAVVCCRWGLLGGAVTWALFALLAAGGLLVAGCSRDPFARLVAVGVVTLILAQMAVNTGMTIGLLPITGLTLPFVSYGGSSLVATWAMVGLLYGLGLRRRQTLVLRDSFEFGDGKA